MKTADEIKRQLITCLELNTAKFAPEAQHQAMTDALALIQQLEATVSEKEKVVDELSGKIRQLEAKRKQLLEKIELLEANSEEHSCQRM